MYYKLFINMVVSFIMLIIVTVLSHEFGHYAVARCIGYKHVRVHYVYTNYDTLDDLLVKKHGLEDNRILNNIYDLNLNKEKLLAVNKEIERNVFLLALGGPVETLVVGTICFLLLVANKKSFGRDATLNFNKWLLIFLSLFWLRPVVIMFTELSLLSKDRPNGGDEFAIASFLNVNYVYMYLVLGVIGVSVFCISLFVFIPKSERLVFVFGGIFGSIIGYWLWFVKLGPFLLP